jgi:hypothetical protein
LSSQIHRRRYWRTFITAYAAGVFVAWLAIGVVAALRFFGLHL